nr:DUF484 family protein [Vibrio quintilis]
MEIEESDALTAEVVAEYLRHHPDFFIHRPELAERLTLPQEPGAVSLAHIQMRRQRQRIESLEEEITALMSLAAGNDRTFQHFMVLQEDILRCDELFQVIRLIEQRAADINLRAYIRLSAPLSASQYRLDMDYWQSFSRSYLNGSQAYLGRMRKVDRDGLFGGQTPSPEFGSYVVLPLESHKMAGILAFSSEDGGHFQPSMDTLFLYHLGVVLSHLIDILPWKRS